jgi:hypothetical protein
MKASWVDKVWKIWVLVASGYWNTAEEFVQVGIDPDFDMFPVFYVGRDVPFS